MHPGSSAGTARYYVDIAAHGYEAMARDALRFFPLIPLLAKPLIWFGIPAHASVVIVSNVSALVAGVLLYILARREARDAGVAVAARRGCSRLAPGALRPRHGVHGGDDDRARRRDVPRPAGEAVVDRRGDSACSSGLSRPSGFLLRRARR